MAALTIFWCSAIAILFYLVFVIFHAIASLFTALENAGTTVAIIGFVGSLVAGFFYVLYAIVVMIIEAGFFSALLAIVAMIIGIVVLIALGGTLGLTVIEFLAGIIFLFSGIIVKICTFICDQAFKIYLGCLRKIMTKVLIGK